MIIDDKRVLALTKYTKKGKVVSDHNIMVGKFKLNFNRPKTRPRIELFDFKNKENQEDFFEETNSTYQLSSSFTVERRFLHNSNIFLKNLKSSFHTCFKKIRITHGIKSKYRQKSVQDLLKLKMDQKQLLLNCKDESERLVVSEKLEQTEILLSENFALKSAEIVQR